MIRRIALSGHLFLIIKILHEMKNVLMILFFLTSLAVSDAIAQANCKPANCTPANCHLCPPGCCIFNCAPSKGSAASASTDPQSEVAFASFIVDGKEVQAGNCNLTRKEMKSCIASCKKANVSNTASGCQPAACQKGSAQVAKVNVPAAPAVTKI